MRIYGTIVGAGIIGSAIAYELSRRGVSDLHVFDPDLDGSLSSTERNAGGVRHLWHHPVNVELARHSISLFEKIRDEIGFQQKGYLWLYSKERAQEGQRILQNARDLNLVYEELSVSELRSRYPFIDKTQDLAFAIFGPKDGLINSNALKNYYRMRAKERGVIFHDRHWLESLIESESHTQIETVELDSEEKAHAHLRRPDTKPTGTKYTWESDFVILCAGPWMSQLLKHWIRSPLVQPIRRQICLFKAQNFDMTPYGMIVDTSRVYFHPEGGNIIGGFVVKEESPGFRFDYDDTFFETYIWPELYERSTKMERIKFLRGWSGLYSYTPDTSGILGVIPGLKRTYEVHSFTGRGVMQSYGAAVALAELLLDRRFQTFDASSLSRERFASNDPNRSLQESLHI